MYPVMPRNILHCPNTFVASFSPLKSPISLWKYEKPSLFLFYNQLLPVCKRTVLSYFWLERLPSCVTLFPEQTDTSGQVKLSILHLSSALVFLTIWPDQLCQFVPLCLPPQKDCYKVSPSYFATIQTFLRFFLRHFNEMQSFTFISYYKSELFKIFP